MKKYDILIIGGGICGMTAAIYAARANLSICLLEKMICGGLVNSTNIVGNFPSYQSIHGLELMSKTKEQTASLGVTIEEVNEVERVELSGAMKRIFTSMGGEYEAPAVIVATGRIPRKFPVETDFTNIHYCSVCDGSPYKEKKLIVLGGGNSAFDESLYLLTLGVHAIHIIETFPSCIADASTQAQALDTGKIRVSTSTDIIRVDALPSGRGLIHLRNRNSGEDSVEEADGIFCFIGQEPNSSIFEGILDMEGGYIKVNTNMETSIPGVFAAGDVTVKKYRQITTAMGDGTIAALQAGNYLRKR